MRDLVSDMERRHRAWGKGFTERDDFPEEDTGDASIPHPQGAPWPQPGGVTWTPEQCKFAKDLIKKHMAATGETREQAIESILKRMRGEKEDA